MPVTGRGTAWVRTQWEISLSSCISTGHRSVAGRLIPTVGNEVMGTWVPVGVWAMTSPARSGSPERGGRSRIERGLWSS